MPRNQNATMYVYVVACVGLLATQYATIRMRTATLHANAERIARQQYPGMLAYKVQSIDAE